MTNKCIISFANSRANYAQSLARLSDSLRNNFDGDFLAWHSESALGAPLHVDNPYAFKIYAFGKAIEAGYTQILWLDSSCFAIKNVSPVFDEIDKTGYIMQDAGHYIGNWTNDMTIQWYNYTRDNLMEVKCHGNAGFLGLNMESEIGKRFFEHWKYAMQTGLFKGNWTNSEKTESNDERCLGHRHDLSAGSIIRHNLSMKLQPGDQWLQYAGPYDETANDTIIFKAQGI